jgi:hypothetical protein
MNTVSTVRPLPTAPAPGYFFGGGRSGAGSAAETPDLCFLVGPTYTSPNFLASETLSVEIDGVLYPLDMVMDRLPRSGIFQGTREAAGLSVELVDFAPWDSDRVLRKIRVYNLSERTALVRILATVRPACRTARAVDSRVEIDAGVDEPIFCWCEIHLRNWEARRATLFFSGEGASTACIGSDAASEVDSGPKFLLSSRVISLLPGSEITETLHHHLSFVAETFAGSPSTVSPASYASDPEADLASCLADWASWFSEGIDFPYPDARTRHVVEGTLATIRSLRSFDGGFMACPRCYAFSYLRDSHGGLRGLAAAGHTKELGSFLRWVHATYLQHGYIVNSASNGGDLVQNLDSSDENLASESTAYHVLLARYYERATGDASLLLEIESSLKFAVDAQLRYADVNDGRLRFNGDETEQYVPVEDGAVYGFGSLPDFHRNAFSLASAAAAVATADFFADHLDRTGRDGSAYRKASDELRQGIERHLRTPEQSFHHWMQREDGTYPTYPVTNYLLMSLWMDARLASGSEREDALATLVWRDPTTGFLPLAPPIHPGFTGHTLALLLHDLTRLRHPLAPAVFQTLVHGPLPDRWGTYSEFFGPGGVSNTHNFNIFSSGIAVDAILFHLFGRDVLGGRGAAAPTPSTASTAS